MLRKLRTVALLALCGGMLFQTTSTGCDTVLASIISTLISSGVSALVGT